MTNLELILCVLLLGISGFLSASEIALFSLSRFQLRNLKDNFRPAHRKIKSLLSDPGGLLVSILVSNEVVNISLSTIIIGVISRNEPPEFVQWLDIPGWAMETFLSILITTPLILFFCEITPKVVGAQINRIVAPLVVTPLGFIYRFLAPIRTILKWGLKFVTGSGPLPDPRAEILKESEFLLLIEEGHKEGAIDLSEVEAIKNVFRMDNTTALDIATPLSQVFTLSPETTIKASLVHVKKFSRIPVRSKNKKEIVGILYSKDILRSKLHQENLSNPIHTIMRKPLFINPDIRLSSLFRMFKKNKVHMGILKSVNNEIQGLITMNDVLDYLFEDFFQDEVAARNQARTPSRIEKTVPPKESVSLSAPLKKTSEPKVRKKNKTEKPKRKEKEVKS